MKLATSLAAHAAVLMILAAPATAATPKLSGAYVYSGTSACQGKFTVTLGSAGVEFTLGSAGVEFTSGQVMYTPTQSGTGVRTVKTGSVVKTVRTDSVVSAFATQSNGSFTETIGTMTFNATTHNVAINYIDVGGDAMLMVLGTGSGGQAVTRKTKTKTSAFSNTDTTVAIAGLGGVAFDAVYGNIASGIANHVNLLRKEGTNCVTHGTLVRQ
jgi:hypothetical protein